MLDTTQAHRCALGDVWSCSIALESSTVEYKFAILDGKDDEVRNLLIKFANNRLRFTSLISATWAVILGLQVLEWQPGDNRSLSVPDGAALEVFDSWEGAHPPRRASPCCAAKGQAAAPSKQSQIVSAELAYCCRRGAAGASSRCELSPSAAAAIWRTWGVQRACRCRGTRSSSGAS